MLLIPLLVLILFLGLEITIILKLETGLPERLSLSFLLGIGLSTLAVFLLAYFFNLNFSLLNTFGVLISLCIILFTPKSREVISFLKNTKFGKVKIKPKVAIFWGLILIIFGFTLLANIYWPIFDWDALALYDFRAKAFLVDTNLIHASLTNGYFLGYPLLTSLAHLFVYQVGLNNPKFIYSLFYLSFIVVFYHSLRRNVSENKAMIFTLLLSLVPQMFAHAAMAYTNLPYVVYLCAGTFYLYDWIKNKDQSSLVLSAVLVGLSSWVRSYESFWVVPIFVTFVVSIRNKKWKEIVTYVFIILALSLPWKYFVSYVSYVPTPVVGATGQVYFNTLKNVNFNQIYLVTKYLFKYVFFDWGLLFLTFIFVSIRSLYNKKLLSNQFLNIIFLFFALLFAGTLIFSMTFPEWQDIPDSARRLSMFLLPLMIYSIALDIGPRHEENKK